MLSLWQAYRKLRNWKFGYLIERGGILIRAYGYALVACMALSSPAMAQPPDVGAIRWDAWYGSDPSTPAGPACRAVSPQRYHFRAPWFSTKQSDDRMDCDGAKQGVMDQEISYAKDGGIKYWAFVWYKPNSPNA
jgi:hypothetical protein